MQVPALIARMAAVTADTGIYILPKAGCRCTALLRHCRQKATPCRKVNECGCAQEQPKSDVGSMLCPSVPGG